MSETPQWVRIACQRWGRQKRRLWAGGDWYRDHRGIQRRHVDGYANSFLGRLLEERGAFEGRKSLPAVAEALGVTRFTVYNYLNRSQS